MLVGWIGGSCGASTRSRTPIGSADPLVVRSPLRGAKPDAEAEQEPRRCGVTGFELATSFV